MRTVFEAASGVEAHMVLHMLEQADIAGRIDGELLPGAAGELPAMGLVRVMVDEADAERARGIIAAWEAREKATVRPRIPEVARSAIWFVAGALLGGGVVLSVHQWPESRQDVDFDGDGMVDETVVYAGVRLSRVEVDQNADGHADEVWEYSRNGRAELSRQDLDFNGSFETTTRYRGSRVIEYSTDADGDGRAEYREQFSNGRAQVGEYLDRDSGQVVKRVFYGPLHVTRAEYDADRDGTLETTYQYDALGEITSTVRAP